MWTSGKKVSRNLSKQGSSTFGKAMTVWLRFLCPMLTACLLHPPPFVYSNFTLGPIHSSLWPFFIISLLLSSCIRKCAFSFSFPKGSYAVCHSHSSPYSFVPPDITPCRVGANHWCPVSLAHSNGILQGFFWKKVFMLFICIEHESYASFPSGSLWKVYMEQSVPGRAIFPWLQGTNHWWALCAALATAVSLKGVVSAISIMYLVGAKDLWKNWTLDSAIIARTRYVKPQHALAFYLKDR